jgi:predicted PurR-regulated permease PerM
VTVEQPPAAGGETRDRWIVIFLVLGSAYFGFLLAERLLDFLGGFSSILLVVFLAALLAFVMSPLVAALQARLQMSRAAAVGIAYTVALVAIGFALFYAGSAITQDIARLAADYDPTKPGGIEETLAAWQGGLHLPSGFDLVSLYRQAAEYIADTIGDTLVQSAQSIAGVTIAALGSLFLILILSLYMVADSARIINRLKRLVPRRYLDEADILERSISRAFGGFLRAQLILAGLQAVLVAVVGLVFGIQYLFLVATLSTLAMLIPVFGPPLALVPPIVVAAVFSPAGFLDLGAFLPVAVILVVVQTVLVNWLQPRLMQGAVGLHPILVLVGLLVGAQVAGVWGALFGIPVIAVMYVFASYILFRAVPNAALPEREQLDDVHQHTLVAVEKEQLSDETHPHIHVTRTRRADGSEEVSLDFDENATTSERAKDAEDAPA